MRFCRVTPWAIAVQCGLFVVSSFSADASPPSQQREPLVFKTGVALVTVPVFVTDKDGKAVRGLTAADFEVEDGGKRVPIVAFRAVDVDAPIEDQTDLPPAVQKAVAEPRRFVLLLDVQFSSKTGSIRGRQAAIKFIRQGLAEGDLIAVATSGGMGLKVSPFTKDHEAAVRAIGGIGVEGAVGDDPAGTSDAMTASGNAKVDSEQAAIDALMFEGNTRLYRMRIGDFLHNLSTLVVALGPLPGRKQIVLLSGGFPESAWQASPAAGGQNNPVGGQYGPAGDSLPTLNGGYMQEIFQEASRSDVVIHTIDLAGIVEGSSSLSENSGAGTLIAMAHNTGGRAIRRTNDFGLALKEVDRVSRTSYVIAFQVAEPDKGKTDRKLKVRVRGDGLSVSHRKSYVLPTQAASVVANAETASEGVAKGELAEPLRLSLTTVPYLDPQGKAYIHSILHVEGAALSEGDKANQLAIQIQGSVIRAGRSLEPMALSTSLDLVKVGEAVRGSGFRMLTAFPASPGSQDLRFLVKIGASGATRKIETSVSVPDFAAGSQVLSTPMLMLSRTGVLAFPFQPQGRPRIDVPFRLGSEAFVPDAALTLTTGQASDLCVFAWPARPEEKAPLDVSAELVVPGEVPQAIRVDGAPRVVKDPDGFDRYVVTLIPTQAPPGPYTLRLTFLDRETARSHSTETAMTLVK